MKGSAGVTDEETGQQTPATLTHPSTPKSLGILGVCHFFVTLKKADSSLPQADRLAGARRKENVGYFARNDEH
jgi:hypothetical protein